MANLGLTTTRLTTGLLAIFGLLAINPNILQNLIGDVLWARWGLALISFLIVFTNFLYPRLKAMCEAQEPVVLDNGSISSFFATLLGIFATIGFAYPDAIIQFLGNMGLASYSTTVIFFLTAIYDMMFPRNSANQPPVEEPAPVQ